MPAPEQIRNDTPDPRERDLARRSKTPAVGIWVILALILMAVAVVYVVSAIL
ncbi:hypothetical protein [Brevundimonas sp.]